MSFCRFYLIQALHVQTHSDQNVSCSYACSLLRQGMNQIIITLESPDIMAVEKAGEKNAIARVNTSHV